LETPVLSLGKLQVCKFEVFIPATGEAGASRLSLKPHSLHTVQVISRGHRRHDLSSSNPTSNSLHQSAQTEELTDKKGSDFLVEVLRLYAVLCSNNHTPTNRH
jgi:hypothetical protein